MRTVSPTLLDKLSDCINKPDTKIHEFSELSCYFPIGETVCRWSVLEKAEFLSENADMKSLRDALPHGYFVLEPLKEDGQWSLLRYEQPSEEAKRYTIEDIKRINYELRKSTTSAFLETLKPREGEGGGLYRSIYDMDVLESHSYIYTIGRFFIEFSQLIITMNSILSPIGIYTSEGYALGDTLDKELFGQLCFALTLKLKPFKDRDSLIELLKRVGKVRNDLTHKAYKIPFSTKDIEESIEKINLCQKSLVYIRQNLSLYTALIV